MPEVEPRARVIAVSTSAEHGPHKRNRELIQLLAGLGVEGDAHAGETVRHRSRRRANPDLPNLRQVHLIAAELHAELRERGFEVKPGEMGENLTTEGIELLALPRGTRLRLGARAAIELTGLRNPCAQLDGIAPGLMKATLDRDPRGELIRRAGVMAIVLQSGEVKPGDPIEVDVPAGPGQALEPV